MDKYRLKRIVQYTEVVEIEAIDWDEAKQIIYSDEIEFDRVHDDTITDYKIEFLGEVEKED